jgi:predicted transcriptional regulator
MMPNNDEILELRRLTRDIVVAVINTGNEPVDADGKVMPISRLISAAFTSLSSLGVPPDKVEKPVADVAPERAHPDRGTEIISPTQVRASIKKDSITCLICGKTMRVLTKHLREAHQITNAEYRQKFGLPKDQPLAAKDLSEQKRIQSKHLLKPRASRKKPILNLGLE